MNFQVIQVQSHYQSQFSHIYPQSNQVNAQEYDPLLLSIQKT